MCNVERYAGPVPGCVCGKSGPGTDAQVKLLSVGVVDGAGERAGRFRCEACGEGIEVLLDEDDPIPAHIPVTDGEEDGRVHLRFGKDEQEVVGYRELVRGAVFGEP